MRWVLVALGLWVFGCSDDSGQKADMTVGDAPMPSDAGPEAGPDQSAPDQTVAPPCELSTLGQPCTQGGGECGAVNTCLITEGSAGFCSCACLPDDTTTELIDEDSCPGTDFACGLDAASAPRCLGLLANTPQLPNCAKGVIIVADPTDTAFMVAARIVPKTYPFTLVGLRYTLQGPGSKTAECDTGLAHRAEVHVNDQSTPSPTPTVLESFSMSATTSTKEPRQVRLALAAPVQVKAGEAIYVTVEVVRDGSKSLCTDACADDSATGAKSYIDVDSDQPPYVWESFESMQWGGDLSFAALGY
jgi:hypothetical protein